MNQFGAQNMDSQIKKVLLEKPHKNMSKVDYKKWNYQGNLNQKLIDNNYNDFLQIIINAKVKIIYLCDYTNFCFQELDSQNLFRILLV